MKKITSAMIAMLIILSSVIGHAKNLETTIEVPKELYSKYRCTFDVTIDSSMQWLYDISNNGSLKIDITDAYVGTVGPILATFTGKSELQIFGNNGRSFGNKGHWEFNPYGGIVENGKISIYNNINPAVDTKKILAIDLKQVNGKNDISLYLMEDDMKATSIFSCSNFSEDGDLEYKGVLFSIDGTYEPIPIREDMTSIEDDKPDVKSDENNEVDYGAFSVDERRWDNKENAIEAYGKYRDENGVFHSVLCLRGNFMKAKNDYKIKISAQFETTDNKSNGSKNLSSNGTLKYTFYSLMIYVDGKEWQTKELVKVFGDKGFQWFESGNIEYRQSDSRFETISGSKLQDGKSVYMGFRSVTIENNIVDLSEEASEIMSFTFIFDGESKTKMTGIDVELEGSKKNSIGK